MEKEIIYDFKIIFSCGTEYKFEMKGSQKIFEIQNKLGSDLKITIPKDLPIMFSKYDILKFKDDQIKDLQFFLSEEINEININLPLSGNMSSYFENDDLIYDFKDDDEIPFTIKVEKKKINKNAITIPKNAAAALLNKNANISTNNHNNNLEAAISNLDLSNKDDLNKLDDIIDEIYFHPEKITKLSAKTKNVTQKMLEQSVIKLPIQIDLEVDEFPSNPKASLDLICVIDKSGSMNGDPINSVKKSLESILDLLGEKDRLCLIEFDSSAKRITNLLQMKKSNKVDFKEKIDALEPGSQTNIGSGLQQALETLVQRKLINNISSIFLLSDGLDNFFQEENCEKLLDKMERLIKSDKFKDFNYSINTFGYSEYHDSDLLSKLSLIKKGNFYFINDFNNTPIIFKDCIEFLQRVICKELIITLKPTNNSKIVKVYGEENWNIDGNGLYYTKINQLTYKRKLNFTFDVEVINLNKQSVEILKKNGLSLMKIEGKLIGLNEYGNPAANIQTECVTFLEKDNIKLDIYPDILVNIERFNLCEIIKKKIAI